LLDVFDTQSKQVRLTNEGIHAFCEIGLRGIAEPRRAACNERSLALNHMDEAFGLENVVCLLHGQGCDEKLPREVAMGRQLIADTQATGSKQSLNLFDNLSIDRA
jgi:hypothetical protein